MKVIIYRTLNDNEYVAYGTIINLKFKKINEIKELKCNIRFSGEEILNITDIIVDRFYNFYKINYGKEPSEEDMKRCRERVTVLDECDFCDMMVMRGIIE